MFKNYRIKVAHSQQLLIQKSKMASMGEMIGNIAHQWRQPLSQLSGLFFDIESAYDFKELDKKYLTNTIDEANDLVEYMSKTIDDFKEFFNPNAKKEKFNLLEPINNALNIVSSALKSNHIQLNINVDNSLYVEGLSNEFSQVILNLLSNSQEIALLRDIKKPKINIFTELYKNEIFLHVEDNCGGIDEAILDKIFEPYFTTKFHYGTGIGLYMSKIIVENKMNGHIYVKNIENNKTRFTITIKKSLL
jgi:signal transduction histidine kinase